MNDNTKVRFFAFLVAVFFTGKNVGALCYFSSNIKHNKDKRPSLLTELQFVFARITRFGPILKKSIDLVENSENLDLVENSENPEKPCFGPILKKSIDLVENSENPEKTRFGPILKKSIDLVENSENPGNPDKKTD